MFDFNFWLQIAQGGALAFGVTVGVWAVIYLYRLIFKKDKPPEGVLQIIVAVGTIAVAFYQIAPSMPPFAGDPIGWLMQFVTIAGAIFAAAQILYDKVWALVLVALDKLFGFTYKAHSLKGQSQS